MTSSVSIDFSTEELVLLSELTSMPMPAGVGVESLELLPTEYRAYARSSAQAALTARRVIESGVDGPEVPEPIQQLLEVLGRPGMLGVANVQTGEIVETRFYCADPDLGVEHEEIGPSVHRLSPFPTREFLSRILTFVDLRPADVNDAPPFDATLAQLETVDQLVSSFEVDAAIQLLVDSGATQPAAAGFVAAIQTRRASVTITLLYKSTDTHTEGGVISWIDGGLNGYWLTDQADEDAVGADAPITVSPASAEALVSQLASYLPTADPSSSSELSVDR